MCRENLAWSVDRLGRKDFPPTWPTACRPVKWRNWKAHLIWQENMYAPPQKIPLPKITNLLNAPISSSKSSLSIIAGPASRRLALDGWPGVVRVLRAEAADPGHCGAALCDRHEVAIARPAECAGVLCAPWIRIGFCGVEGHGRGQ